MHRETHLGGSMVDDIRQELGMNDREDERLMALERFGTADPGAASGRRARRELKAARPLGGSTTRYDVGAYRRSARRAEREAHEDAMREGDRAIQGAQLSALEAIEQAADRLGGGGEE